MPDAESAPAVAALPGSPSVRQVAAPQPMRWRRTPCIGICSTTYGDLVCRGCKRFAHEIVGWNAYEERQRDLIWQRLHALLGQSVRVHLRIIDEERLRAIAQEARVPDASTLPAEVLAFQTMRFRPLPLDALGLAATSLETTDTRDAIAAIDREFHLRSRAHYEASFKTPA